VYTKTTMTSYKLRCRPCYNGGTTLWNSGKEGKEKRTIETKISKCRTYLQLEDVTIYMKAAEKWGV
jgi:hypothetical protein